MFSSCMFRLNTIYHHTGITACTADGKSAWTQVSQLQCSLHFTTWQFLTTQLCRCENLWLKYLTDTCSSSTIAPVLYPNPAFMGWIQDWQLVKTILNTCCWSSTTNVLCLYFIFGSTYCKLSFVGFCWYHPGSCVPSSFHWRDLLAANPSVSNSCWNSLIKPGLLTESTTHYNTHRDGQQCKESLEHCHHN